jgi:hypothetical protein
MVSSKQDVRKEIYKENSKTATKAAIKAKNGIQEKKNMLQNKLCAGIEKVEESMDSTKRNGATNRLHN